MPTSFPLGRTGDLQVVGTDRLRSGFVAPAGDRSDPFERKDPGPLSRDVASGEIKAATVVPDAGKALFASPPPDDRQTDFVFSGGES